MNEPTSIGNRSFTHKKYRDTKKSRAKEMKLWDQIWRLRGVAEGLTHQKGSVAWISAEPVTRSVFVRVLCKSRKETSPSLPPVCYKHSESMGGHDSHLS